MPKQGQKSTGRKTGKFGIEETAARDISNILTAQDIPADMTANLGDYKDEPDGLPGPMTRQAISAWQERMQLKSSGAMDSASLKSMGLDELSESELLSGAGEKSE